MLPGISGNLLPLQFISNHLQFADHPSAPTKFTLTLTHPLPTAPAHPLPSTPAHPITPSPPHPLTLSPDRFSSLWHRIAATCGPATGLRTLADLAAMPLVAELGFAASSADFGTRVARFSLRARTPRPPARTGALDPRQPPPAPLDPFDAHQRPVALLVAPWANRSPAIWRDAIEHARGLAADWCLIVAPPILQIVDARAHWSRRFIEFSLTDAAEHPGTFARLAALASPAALDNTGDASLRQIVAAAAKFQDQVRADLQRGVAAGLDALGGVRLPRAESLAIVYRVLFLLFVESRDLIPWRHPLYRPAYSIGTLCETARHDPRAPGFWDALAAVSRLLRAGCQTPRLDVPPFNGRLFARAAAPSLERPRATRSSRAARDDGAMATTLVSLSTRPTRYGRETIAYPDLGVEQLGAVYERVLGLPDRKQSGTFYTPRALTEFVVRETLAPLTRAASADQILDLKILDPSMGSGAFLVAACRHLAAAYERALVREHRLSEAEIDGELESDFRRLVAQRCLYGVDKNPTAVELARLSLWLATLARGKPLSFLDHRLRAGDALVGARPDDLRVTSDRRRQDTALPLFDLDASLEVATGRAVTSLRSFDATSDDTVEAVRRKEATWSRLVGESSSLRSWRLASDLWCARWFAGAAAPSPPELRAAIDALVRGDGTLPPGPLTRWLLHAKQLSDGRGFFHWPLEFADVFFDADGRSKPRSGFDAVVGNPPWEMLRTDHGDGDPKQLVRFIRDAGVYGSCGRGHVNLYQPFLERALGLARPGGRVGLVLPWGLASDDGAAALRARLFDRCTTTAVVGLDNAGGIFPVHRGLRFLALFTGPGGRTEELTMTGGVTSAGQLERLRDDSRRGVADMRISRGTLAAVGGKSRRLPDVRRPRDLALLDSLMRRWPALGADDGWRVEFGRELNVTEDRGVLGDRGLPAIEGKHVQPFAVDIQTPRFRILPAEAMRALPGRAFEHPRLAYRDVSAVSNRQSLIAAIVPGGVVTTHTLFCLKTPLELERQHFLCACFNSYVLNAIVRMLMGGHLTTSLVEGLPVPRWTHSAVQRRIARLSARRSSGRATRHDGARLQALIARDYGIDRETFGDLLETFPLIPAAERREALAQFEDILMRG